MRTPFAAVAVLAVASLGACGGGGGDGQGGGSATPQSGVAKGLALATDQQPLAGARVTMCDPLTFDSAWTSSACASGDTGADGRYSIALPGGRIWRSRASVTRQYNGKTYCMELTPSDTSTFSSAEGAVRNFTWRLTGVRPGESPDSECTSYLGQCVQIEKDYAREVDTSRAVVTFTPAGPLVDGTAGTTITARTRDWTWGTIGDIPLGRYTVTARFEQQNGTFLPLQVRHQPGGTFASSVVVDFSPAAGGTCGRQETARLAVGYPL